MGSRMSAIEADYLDPDHFLLDEDEEGDELTDAELEERAAEQWKAEQEMDRLENPETCTICDSRFNMELEGGIDINLGLIPVTMCVTCNAGLVEYALDQYAETLNEEE